VQIISRQAVREGYEFTLQYQEQKFSYFLPMFGSYNVWNAAAVFALVKSLNWKVDIDQAFRQFLGVKRRQELIGQPRDIQIIEDFAHHPTAVEKTIATFCERPGIGKIHAVFEPRSATSRRNIFQAEYARAFSQADFTYIAKPYAQEKIPLEQRFSSEKLVSDIEAQAKKAFLCNGVDDIIQRLQKNAQPGDTVLIMSNGGFDGIYQKLLAGLA
jgi:UDP-N-acetylmuramate: L-alanyl-gamma-D-glutamyl-meso-diaminopimelate ligase